MVRGSGVKRGWKRGYQPELRILNKRVKSAVGIIVKVRLKGALYV